MIDPFKFKVKVYSKSLKCTGEMGISISFLTFCVSLDVIPVAPENTPRGVHWSGVERGQRFYMDVPTDAVRNTGGEVIRSFRVLMCRDPNTGGAMSFEKEWAWAPSPEGDSQRSARRSVLSDGGNALRQKKLGFTATVQKNLKGFFSSPASGPPPAARRAPSSGPSPAPSVGATAAPSRVRYERCVSDVL